MEENSSHAFSSSNCAKVEEEKDRRLFIPPNLNQIVDLHTYLWYIPKYRACTKVMARFGICPPLDLKSRGTDLLAEDNSQKRPQ